MISGDGGEVVGEDRTTVEQEDAEIRFSIASADVVGHEYSC